MADDQARADRLAQLEARLAKKPSVGLMPPVAALAVVAALGLLAMQRAEFSYFFSSKSPIDLGTEGGYHFENAVSNRYAQVHGTPTVRGAYFLEGDATRVAVGAQNTPLMISRATLPTENWEVGKTAPQPDQRSFLVKGRLLNRADAQRLEPAFAQLSTWGEVKPEWVLVAEAHPGQDIKAMAWLWGLIAFAAINAWLLVRGLFRR